MRNYGIPQFLDLVPDGNASPTPVNGKPTLVEFLIQAPKAGIGADVWPIGLNYVIAGDFTFDQAAAGGAAVEWEDWAGFLFDHFDVNIPLIGNTHPGDTFTGRVSKHLIEWVSSGYAYSDGARAQIAAADGDSGLVFYQVLPMAHECFE